MNQKRKRFEYVNENFYLVIESKKQPQLSIKVSLTQEKAEEMFTAFCQILQFEEGYQDGPNFAITDTMKVTMIRRKDYKSLVDDDDEEYDEEEEEDDGEPFNELFDLLNGGIKASIKFKENLDKVKKEQKSGKENN